MASDRDMVVRLVPLLALVVGCGGAPSVWAPDWTMSPDVDAPDMGAPDAAPVHVAPEHVQEAAAEPMPGNIQAATEDAAAPLLEEAQAQDAGAPLDVASVDAWCPGVSPTSCGIVPQTPSCAGLAGCRVGSFCVEDCLRGDPCVARVFDSNGTVELWHGTCE